MSEQQKVALITGCSSGIGLAAALAFHSAGWRVVATMRDPDAWKGDVSGEGLLVLPLDVTEKGSINSAFDAAIEHFGRVDVVVNNAGMGLFSVFESTPDELVRQVFETNFFGALAVMRAAISQFQRQGGGRIVNVTSSSAFMPEGLMATYAASKAALDIFTEGVRFELTSQNTSVKLIEPGYIPETNFTGQTRSTASGLDIPSAYGAYVQQRLDHYESLEEPEAFSSESEVADAILEAANDQTGKLRWVIGSDAEQAAHMRRETSEQAWSEWQDARNRAPT